MVFLSQTARKLTDARAARPEAMRVWSLCVVAALSAPACAWLASPRLGMAAWGGLARAGAPAMVDPFVLDRLREMRRVHDELSARLEDPAVQVSSYVRGVV